MKHKMITQKYAIEDNDIFKALNSQIDCKIKQQFVDNIYFMKEIFFNVYLNKINAKFCNNCAFLLNAILAL